MRQLGSSETTVLAPVFSMASILVRAIAPDSSANFTENVPPNLQQGKMLFETNCGACHTLAKAGTDKSKLLTATIWLSDIRTVDEMNKVWDAWVTPGHTPARACIEALLQGPEKKIEIQVTAAR